MEAKISYMIALRKKPAKKLRSTNEFICDDNSYCSDASSLLI
jgi:hypothetical protein